MIAPRFAFLTGALVLTFATGCPKKDLRPAPPGPPTERQALAAEVQKLSASAEELLREQDQRIWLGWTRAQQAHVEESYAGYEDLFTAESISRIERLRGLSTDPSEIRALTHLEVHFVGEFLSASLVDLNDSLANLEASLTFTLDGREYPYRNLERLLASEASTPRRRALYDGATEPVQRLTTTLARREERIGQLLTQLGYPSYEAFGAELRQVDLQRLAYLSEELLGLTQAGFVETMDKLARRELALPLTSIRRADFPRLFQPRGVDPLFARDTLLPRVTETLAGMGIELGALPNLLIDAEAHAGKDPRPLAIAPRVPQDVRLTFTPANGIRVQAALLHEVGHALHLAFTFEQRFEVAKLGANAQAEAFSYLFEDLLEDPIWLEEKTGLSGERLQGYLYATSAHKLYRLRRAAGLLLYQLELRRRAGHDARALYGEIMSRTYAVPMTENDAERYLVETEDFFESADEFRAWFLAAQLQAQLKTRFGPRWWASREAGMFLKEQWKHGNALAAREVAQAIGEDGIRADVLLLRLATTLNIPIRLNASTQRNPDGAPESALGVPEDSAAPAGSADGGTPPAPPAASGDPGTPPTP
ncbi:MAG: chromosome segregation protein SMC [Myxococcota bacterium]|nr:chromosome segregation protein SMC [Myxococcota bacterium]